MKLVRNGTRSRFLDRFAPVVKLWYLAIVGSMFLLPCCTVVASTYYLAPDGDDRAGDGSLRRPWRTIGHATNVIPDDGSTVVLADGLYEGHQSLARHFQRLCTVRAQHPYRAKLRSASNGNRLFSCYNGSNVRFEGLELLGSGGQKGEYLVHISTKNAYRLVFENCILHDSYHNDLVKINAGTHHILFRSCIFFNQNDHGGDEHLDINTVTDVMIEGSIFFNDFAGSGRPVANASHSFIVIKNSGRTPDVTRRIALRSNLFLHWQGKPDQAYVLLGEDGKPFFEAQEITIENNLFVYNSPVRFWGAFLFKGGLKNIVVRANTIVGHPVVGSGAFAVMFQRIGKNPPMGSVLFQNNIWCDPSGNMPDFSKSRQNLFILESEQVIHNNLYWNAGKPIPSDADDVMTPRHDRSARLADPRLPKPDGDLVLPRLGPDTDRFLSGTSSIRNEFRRLVYQYAALESGSPAIDAAEPSSMPRTDILGSPRDKAPDIGCFEFSIKERRD